MSNDNVVFVGRKGPMNYVLAIMTQFDQGHPEVIVKARGQAISKAVDVVEITRHKFVDKAKITNIDISTEIMRESETGQGPTRVSAIEITLAK